VQVIQEGERLLRDFSLESPVVDVIEWRRIRGRLEIRQLSQSNGREGHGRRAEEKRKKSSHGPHSKIV
jgi:hypothetical protein